MISRRLKKKIRWSINSFFSFPYGDIFPTVLHPLPSGQLPSRPVHDLVVILGSFCFSVSCWISCLLDLCWDLLYSFCKAYPLPKASWGMVDERQRFWSFTGLKMSLLLIGSLESVSKYMEIVHEIEKKKVWPWVDNCWTGWWEHRGYYNIRLVC